MSEQAEKTRKVRAERCTEAEGREVLREWHGSGAERDEVCRAAGDLGGAASYGAQRLGQTPAGDVSFVAVPL